MFECVVVFEVEMGCVVGEHFDRLCRVDVLCKVFGVVLVVFGDGFC